MRVKLANQRYQWTACIDKGGQSALVDSGQVLMVSALSVSHSLVRSTHLTLLNLSAVHRSLLLDLCSPPLFAASAPVSAYQLLSSSPPAVMQSITS